MAAQADVTQLRDHVFGLTYAQMAAAVAASPWFDDGPFPAAAEMVHSGLEAVGRAEIERRAAWLSQLSHAKWLGTSRQQRREAAAALAGFWRGECRFNRAHLIAEQVWAECGTWSQELTAGRAA